MRPFILALIFLVSSAICNVFAETAVSAQRPLNSGAWSKFFGGATKALKFLFGDENNSNGNKNGIDIDSAKTLGKQEMKTESPQLRLWLETAKSKILEGKLDESVQDLLKALEIDAENLEANRLLGAVLLAINKPKLAEGLLYTAVRLSQWSDLQSVANLAECLRINGDVDLGEKIALKGLNATNNGDDEGAVGFALGAIYAEKKDYKQSSDWYLSSAISQRNNIDAWIRASTMRFPAEHRDLKIAENVLIEAVRLNPQSAELVFQLAICLHLDNRLQEALALYQAASELDPDNKLVDLKGAYATALHTAGKIVEAFNLYQSAIQISPQNHVLLANFAILLCEHGRQTDGIEVLKRAVAIRSQGYDIELAAKKCQVTITR